MVNMRCTFALIVSGLLSVPVQAALELYYMHNDHLGTPQMITDANRDVVWKGRMMPFGRMDVEVEVVTNHRRFAGQHYDIESALNYNYFRNYDPGLGRYIQSDPTGLRGGLNTYAYAASNPLGNVDPYGLDWYRPSGHPYNAGRLGSPLVAPGYSGNSDFHGGYIDDYVPAGHTFATYHDALVDYLKNEKDWPDQIANIPTMPAAYTAALWREVYHSLGLPGFLPDPASLHGKSNECN